jgi:hypothetical protein
LEGLGKGRITRPTRDEVVKLQNIKIKLCSSVRYRVNEDVDELSNNDYIRNGSEYLIKINEYDSIDELRKEEVDFQESFADIIGLVFDIQDTNVFRDIIIKEDIAYIEKIVRSDIGYDELTRSRRLLGISDEYYSFWATVYDLIQRKYDFTDTDDLLSLIKDDLNLQVNIENIDYNHLDTYESCQIIKDLFIRLGIDIERFNRNSLSYYKIDFSEYHRRNLKEAFENHLMEFKRKLYAWSMEHSQERQFLNNVALYEKNDLYILEKVNEAKNRLELDYNKLVERFIGENFDFKNITPVKIDFEAERDHNEQFVNIEELKGDVELLSLLYFDNKIEEVQEALQAEEEVVSSVDNVESEDEAIEIIDIQLSDVSQMSESPERKPKTPKPYMHPGDSGTTAKGKKSEKIAYKALVEKYGKENVFRKSNEDDSSGYDLKYRDNKGEWKYVEVKTYSGNRFYLTRNEKEFADGHKGRYEIFLVGDEILRIKDVDFSNSNKFKLTSKEYVVEYNFDN